MKRCWLVATAGWFLVTAPAWADPPLQPVRFLQADQRKDTSWAPAMPDQSGALEAADITTYLGTRSLVKAARGAEAHLDDVYTPKAVAPRFDKALGVSLTPINAAIILNTIHLAQVDLEDLVKPVKVPPAKGGRVRPYVQFPALPACDHTLSDTTYHMNESGSYPSTHAAIGMLWALILSRLAPDRSEALFARGYDFGESRLVCGFHYPSDLAAGRQAATVLFAKLEASSVFQAQMASAQAEMDVLRGQADANDLKLLKKVEKLEARRVLPSLQLIQ